MIDLVIKITFILAKIILMIIVPLMIIKTSILTTPLIIALTVSLIWIIVLKIPTKLW